MTDRMAALDTLALYDRPERAQALDDFYTPLCRRSADHRQMACAAGGDPGTGNARSRARTDRAPGFLDGQSEPGALADRRIRASQPHPVQSRRRRRLRFRRRYRARARSEKSAGRGAPHGRVPLLARARATRRARAEATLRRVAATPSLSRDVHDIVARTLADS